METHVTNMHHALFAYRYCRIWWKYFLNLNNRWYQRIKYKILMLCNLINLIVKERQNMI